MLSLWLHCSASGAEGMLGLCCSVLAARVEHGAVPSPHRQPGKLGSRGVSASQLPWDEGTIPW